MSNARLAETPFTPHVGMTWVDAPVNYLADLSIKPVTYNPPVGTGTPGRMCASCRSTSRPSS